MKIKCTFHIAIAFILIQLTDEFSIAFAYGICEKNPYVRILYVTFAILSLLTMIYLYTKYIIRIQMQDLFLGMPLPKKKWCITAVLMPVLICLFYIFFIPEARRAVLFHEQRVEHKGIPAVVVEASFGQRRVVLAGVERRRHQPSQCRVRAVRPEYRYLYYSASGFCGNQPQCKAHLLDVRFDEGKLPEINDAIRIPTRDGGELVVEVSQHLGDDTVRCKGSAGGRTSWK